MHETDKFFSLSVRALIFFGQEICTILEKAVNIELVFKSSKLLFL